MSNETNNPSPILQIGDIAKKIGVSLRTVRFYEEAGLLKPSAITRGGLRLVNDRDVVRLRLIHTLRRLDISIEDIKSILSINAPVPGTKAELLGRSLKALTVAQEKIDEYQTALNELRKNNTIALESVQGCVKCDTPSCKDCPQSIYILS